MFPQKSPFCPLFGPFYPILPSSRLFRAAGASRYPALKERVATFALVTILGPQPRPATSTPGEPGRVRTVKLLPAFLTRLIDKSCAIRMSADRLPRVNEHSPAHRRSAWATRGLASHTELPKSLRTTPSYIVYDNVTQCFGHEPLYVCFQPVCHTGASVVRSAVRTLVCLFSASLPYWRQRREEDCHQRSRERALLVSAGVHDHAEQTVARPSLRAPSRTRRIAVITIDGT